MKITDIRTLRFRAPLPREDQAYTRDGIRSSRFALLVEVKTDEGITGIGSCSGVGPVIEVIIARVLKPLLIGKDPRKLEDLWDECYFRTGVKAFGSRGIGVVALSGIDKSHSRVPIAVGENLHTHFAFQHYLSRKAADVLQPDVARAGGISEAIKIAALAAEQGLPVSLHTYGDAVALAASLHVAAAIDNSTVMELECTHNPLRTELLREQIVMKNGSMIPPGGAGLGIDFNPEVLKKYLFSGDEEISLREKAISGL